MGLGWVWPQHEVLFLRVGSGRCLWESADRLQCFKHPPTVRANQLHADVIGHANVTGRLFTCAVYIRGARMCAKEH